MSITCNVVADILSEIGKLDIEITDINSKINKNKQIIFKSCVPVVEELLNMWLIQHIQLHDVSYDFSFSSIEPIKAENFRMSNNNPSEIWYRFFPEDWDSEAGITFPIEFIWSDEWKNRIA